MDPPSPSKFPISPGMPIFPVSPERVAGTKPPYGGPTPQSPSLQNLRSISPIRASPHRRTDSDVNIMVKMFEGFGVKDSKDALEHTKTLLDKQKSKHAQEIKDLERKLRMEIERRDVGIDELRKELKRSLEESKRASEDSITVSREVWDKQRQDNREAIAKWEGAMRISEEKRRQAERKAHELTNENNMIKTKAQQYKKKNMELQKQNLKETSRVPTLQADKQELDRRVRRLESDLKFHTSEAEKYKNQVYGLQVDLESVEARLNEEVQTLKDKLRLTEGERDALKTSLKEEEVMRVAAEGRIALPAATIEEHDDFGSPVRSPRKQRSPEQDDDKENIVPRKATVELKFIQQELSSEKRLRERAQEQIEFMKMECQFRCCSCRIADMKGSSYVYDGSYTTEMERIKASVPEVTPPPSSHGEDSMEGVVVKIEPMGESIRPFTPPAESEVEQSSDPTFDIEQQPEEMDLEIDAFPFPQPPASPVPEAAVAFSPTTGTFRAVSSPVKAPVATHVTTPAKPSATTDMNTESSPWTPDANSTVIRHETVSPPRFQSEPKPETEEDSQPEPQSFRATKLQNIVIHEDDVAASDEEDSEPQTPLHAPSGPATPGPYLTRTITTTTTIPLHFSPFTPAKKGDNYHMTPSTVAHAPTNAQSQVLGEISFNKLPIDREAALKAIQQRRGRARSMAAGHGTPRKQMMEGVKERRDISAPVARVRR